RSAARAARLDRDEVSDEPSPQGGNRIGDVTLRPQRRSLGVGNPWEGQIPRSELWQQVVRGEKLPSRRPGIHKPPPISWRGGGTLAILSPRSRRAPPLA